MAATTATFTPLPDCPADRGPGTSIRHRGDVKGASFFVAVRLNQPMTHEISVPAGSIPRWVDKTTYAYRVEPIGNRKLTPWPRTAKKEA